MLHGTGCTASFGVETYSEFFQKLVLCVLVHYLCHDNYCTLPIQSEILRVYS